MPDNPNLRHHDGNFLSSQPHEVVYAVNVLQGEFTYQSRVTIRAAVEQAARQARPSELRATVMANARAILRQQRAAI